jgi:hypothetical protein
MVRYSHCILSPAFRIVLGRSSDDAASRPPTPARLADAAGQAVMIREGLAAIEDAARHLIPVLDDDEQGQIDGLDEKIQDIDDQIDKIKERVRQLEELGRAIEKLMPIFMKLMGSDDGPPCMKPENDG